MLAPMRPASERLVLVGLLSFLLWNCLYYTPYVVDDAFISMRYARNLVEGEGLVYNPGERVEGYSNFLWVMASAALQACGLPALTGLKVLGVLAALAAGLTTFLLGRILFREHRGGSLAALLAAGLVCTNTNLAVWSQGGLETALFTALIVGMCLRYEIELEKSVPVSLAEAASRAGRLPISACLFALLWLTRPEAPAYGLYFVLRRWRHGERPGRRDLVLLATLAAVVLPYEVWGLAYYGALFPNTHTAKIGEGLPGLERGLDQLQLFKFVAHQGWAFPALCAVGLLGCLRGWRSVPAAALCPLVSATIFVLYAWSDWMPRFRFMVPMLPALFLLVSYGVLQSAELLRTRSARGASVAVLAVLVLGYVQHQAFAPYYKHRMRESYVFPSEARGTAWFTEVPANLGRRNWPLESMARMILDLAPEGETVVIWDIGFPGLLSMNPIWDLGGLVTPAAARFSADDPVSRQAALDDLFRRRPVLMVIPNRGIVRGFDRAIRDDPRSADYERTELDTIAQYLRKDRAAHVPAQRIRAAMQRFPEYEATDAPAKSAQRQ
jgi:hypothetical protein